MSGILGGGRWMGVYTASRRPISTITHILVGYDVELTDEQAGRPKNEWSNGIYHCTKQGGGDLAEEAASI